MPDVYMQRFRALRNTDFELYLEYAKVKRESYSRWVRPNEVHSFASLSDFVLVEEFLNYVIKDVVTFIAKREVHSLENITRLADLFYQVQNASVGVCIDQLSPFIHKPGTQSFYSSKYMVRNQVTFSFQP